MESQDILLHAGAVAAIVLHGWNVGTLYCVTQHFLFAPVTVSIVMKTANPCIEHQSPHACAVPNGLCPHNIDDHVPYKFFSRVVYFTNGLYFFCFKNFNFTNGCC